MTKKNWIKKLRLKSKISKVNSDVHSSFTSKDDVTHEVNDDTVSSDFVFDVKKIDNVTLIGDEMMDRNYRL